MDVLPTHIVSSDPTFRTNSERMQILVAASARAREPRARRWRAQIRRTSPGARQAPRSRADRPAARSRLAASGALAACGTRHVRQRGARGRARDRHRPRLGSRSRSSSPTTPRSRVARTTQSPSRNISVPSKSRSTIACRASTSSIPAALFFRFRPRSFPIASTSDGSSSTRRACRRSVFPRSRW